MIDTANPTPTSTATKKWLGALLLVAGCGGAVLVMGTLNGVPSGVQRPADREAGSFADTYLLDHLNTTAAGQAAATEQRVAAVETLLQSMTGELVPGSYETILVGHREGSSFPVAVYSYWEDKSFSGSPDQAYYGRACRVYTVGDRAVTSAPVDCPTSVPEQPTGPTLTGEDWPLG